MQPADPHCQLRLCWGILEAAATASSPPFSSRHTLLIRTRIAACAPPARAPESCQVEKHRSPEKFRGGSPAAMFARFGRPPEELLAGSVLLRFPGPLGSGVWACSTGCAHAGSGRHVMAPWLPGCRNDRARVSLSVNREGNPTHPVMDGPPAGPHQPLLPRLLYTIVVLHRGNWRAW